MKPRNHTKYLIFYLVIFALLVSWAPAFAQDEARVQAIRGTIFPGRTDFYLIEGLQRGDYLYVYAENSSGNLDPFIGLTSKRQDIRAIGERLGIELAMAIRLGNDPIQVVKRVADQNLLAWDDDSGPGYSAVFEYAIPNDGDYRLLVSGSLSSLGTDTSGDYRLLVGVNAPQVLTGNAAPQGSLFVEADQSVNGLRLAVEEYQGSLSPQKSSDLIQLHNFTEGDTFYAYVEASSGDWRPVMYLLDFGGKRIGSANAAGRDVKGSLRFTIPTSGSGYSLEISAFNPLALQDGGEYRLLAGLNVDQVLQGTAAPIEDGIPVLDPPIDVQVGVKLQQITEINQKAENYGAVASLRLDWTDPRLAFSPDSCNCRFKSFTSGNFDDFIDLAQGNWPEFTLLNQQGNRWSQNKLAVVFPNGDVTYFERFSATFQAPDFNFRLFPFDQQQFYIRVASVFSEDLYTYSDLPDFTEVGTQLGEEEWYVVDSQTIIETLPSSAGNVTAQFSFRFDAQRYLTFYIWRILVPLGLILLVSWFIFLLRDYGKRVEATSANLLVFVAFNFTISGDLPRLGYMTYMDAILITCFVITVVAVIYNVMLKWLELRGRKELADRIDTFAVWVYPLSVIIAILVITNRTFG